MSERSSIEWTDATWNPIRARGDGKLGWHCEKVSPGCAKCYAEKINGRLGTGLTYTVPNTPLVDLFLDEKTLTAPLRWRKPRKIFVCSMSDLFGEWVPEEWIDRIFAVMALAPQHTFQVLTKRAKRMREYHEPPELYRRVLRQADLQRAELPKLKLGDVGVSDPAKLPAQWIWKGVSAEDQQRLDERVPELLKTPAAVRFLSCEPLLGGIDLHLGRMRGTPRENDAPADLYTTKDRIDWVIVGGESGPIRDVRTMDIEWAREIVRQCREAGVACFVKQLGTFPVYYKEVGSGKGGSYVPLSIRDRKGGDPAEWPEDLRVREFPMVKP